MGEVLSVLKRQLWRPTPETEAEQLERLRRLFGRAGLAGFAMLFMVIPLFFWSALTTTRGMSRSDLPFLLVLLASSGLMLRSWTIYRNRFVMPSMILALASLGYLIFYWAGVLVDYPHDPDYSIFLLFVSIFGLLTIGVGIELIAHLKDKQSLWLERSSSFGLIRGPLLVILIIIYRSFNPHL